MYTNNFITIAASAKKQIQKLLENKSQLLISIDGRCASGKTTLAAYLQENFSCAVIHMDDFFLRPEQRTKKRLNEPGGNVDYERFFEEVILPLKEKKAFSYRPYDCHSQCFKKSIQIDKNQITIIEGSYSAHPYFGDIYDLYIFLDVDKETQMERIRKRNGEIMAERFENLWIPLEEKYFSAFNIQEKNGV